ncbi:hypothetical protein, partial [Saccharopolyspora sp. NPDC003762]
MTPDSGKLGRETVAASQHVQITGVDRSRLHPDQRLPRFWRGDRPGFQPQHIGRLANLSGYERAHGLWHEWPFVSPHPTNTAGVLDKNNAGDGILVGDQALGPSFSMKPARAQSVIRVAPPLPRSADCTERP